MRFTDVPGCIFRLTVSIFKSNYTLCNNNTMMSIWYIFIYIPFGIKKTIPLQAWTDPEDSRRMRLPDVQKIGT